MPENLCLCAQFYESWFSNHICAQSEKNSFNELQFPQVCKVLERIALHVP